MWKCCWEGNNYWSQILMRLGLAHGGKHKQGCQWLLESWVIVCKMRWNPCGMFAPMTAFWKGAVWCNVSSLLTYWLCNRGANLIRKPTNEHRTPIYGLVPKRLVLDGLIKDAVPGAWLWSSNGIPLYHFGYFGDLGWFFLHSKRDDKVSCSGSSRFHS